MNIRRKLLWPGILLTLAVTIVIATMYIVWFNGMAHLRLLARAFDEYTSEQVDVRVIERRAELSSADILHNPTAGTVSVVVDRDNRSVTVTPAAALPATVVPSALTASMSVTGTVWGPYLEWAIENPSHTGNPFDLVATATFTHRESGDTHTTGLFYAGGTFWKFRFTGTRTGTWTFTTVSDDEELNGISGTVNIQANSDANMQGFVSNRGNRWIRTATQEAFIPQFVMFGGPHVYYEDAAQIDQDIQTFLREHGFTGFHVPVFCRWFDINEASCRDIEEASPDPDLRTFEALELLITKTYNAGGTVHIWAWGDDSRGQNPKKWGLNGAVDQRLQRYIAARLGPLPGWTMGYGFDLWEWVTPQQLEQWHGTMQQAFGWPHLLGARGPKNELAQISDAMDYISYEQHKPDYALYAESLTASAEKAVFSEDRFRIRNEGNAKDYTMEETRWGLWRSAMAGGVANIWGNLLGASGANEGITNSAPYPNPEWIQTYARFFENRFFVDMEICNTVTNGMCLKQPDNARFIFYIEDASSIALDLSGMNGRQPAIAVDTKKAYTEINLGTLKAETQSWNAPYPSDWAVAVGNFPATTDPVPTQTPTKTLVPTGEPSHNGTPPPTAFIYLPLVY